MSKRETSKSEKGVALLHASLALGSKDQVPNSGFTSALTWKNFGKSSRLQVWPWNARINPLKERLDRPVWQLLSGPPPRFLNVLRWGGCDTAWCHVLVSHSTTTYPKKNSKSMPSTAVVVKNALYRRKGGVCVGGGEREKEYWNFVGALSIVRYDNHNHFFFFYFPSCPTPACKPPGHDGP